MAPRGVIAAGHQVTAQAGEQVLRDGGNAYDAILAALCAACVAEPVLASPGGGGFLLALPAGAAPRVYDFFVHAPRRRLPLAELDFYEITADFGAATQDFHIGRGTVAVPGMVRGLFAIHADLGTIPLREIVAPAVACAKDGVVTTGYQGYLFDVVKTTFAATAECLALFESPTRPGSLVAEGDLLRQPELADTLETLAIEGADLFYRGEIAQSIARDMARGGQIDLTDLAAYEIVRRRPLEIRHHGAQVHTNPPPSMGGLLAAFGLELMARAEPTEVEPGSWEHLTRLAHVLELTAEARVRAGASTPEGIVSEDILLDPRFLQLFRDRVQGRIASRKGTTQISVLDGAGNLASMTVSNGEGSGYVVPGTGVVLNNMLGEEDLNPAGFQAWPPDHRLCSMMAPSAVLWPDGRAVATGSGGSNRIRTAMLQVIVNLVDFGLTVEEAVHAPRIHWENGLLSIEGGFDPERIRPLLDEYPEHHLWTETNMFFGGAHSVSGDGRSLSGVGDPRRAGVCLTT